MANSSLNEHEYDMKFSRTFEMERDTRNTYRFQEVTERGEAPVIGTVYIQKSVFVTKPQHIRVTIESDDLE